MNNLNIEIILYILGFLLSYILIKIIARNNEKADNWNQIFISFFVSLFSWFTVIVIIIIAWNDIIKKIGIKLPKPPKWL